MSAIVLQDDRDWTEVIAGYERDGATVLRNVVDLAWIDRLAQAIDQILEQRRFGSDLNRPGEGRFFGDVFSWLRVDEIREFLHNSELPEIAAKIMSSQVVRIFYDQLLVKEPGTAKRTPWHQDLPYWPAKGEQILSLWVPIDPATPESGVVTYVKGSHKWNRFFPIEQWNDNADPNIFPVEAQPKGKMTLGDVSRHPENYEFLTWDVEPGDLIVHHPLTVHGAPGNSSQNRRRRALATRWFGDDARWDDSHPHFLRFPPFEGFPMPHLRTGDPFDAELFPVVWPRQA